MFVRVGLAARGDGTLACEGRDTHDLCSPSRWAVVQVYWSENEELCLLACIDNYYVLKYHSAVVEVREGVPLAGMIRNVPPTPRPTRDPGTLMYRGHALEQ